MGSGDDLYTHIKYIKHIVYMLYYIIIASAPARGAGPDAAGQAGPQTLTFVPNKVFGMLYKRVENHAQARIVILTFTCMWFLDEGTGWSQCCLTCTKQVGFFMDFDHIHGRIE